MQYINLLYLTYLISFYIGFTYACKGCVNLDEYSFEKFLPKFEVIIVKFDAAYPYGDKHETYTKFAEEFIDNKNILVGEIGVKDYGDKENEDFAKKYGVNGKDDLPMVKMFLKNSHKYIDFKNNDFSIDNLRSFVKDNTNIYIGLPGCLEEYDKLAAKFVQASDRNVAMREVEQKAEKAKETEKSIVKTYLLIMKKIVEQGIEFVANEKTRLQKLLKDGKVKEKKKMELSQKLNILHSFSLVKDEL